MGALDIRPATGADALAIATVHVRSWQEAYRGLVPQNHLDGLDPDRSRVQWESVLETTAWPSTGTLVLVESDTSPTTSTEKIVGFAGLSATRDDDDDPTSVGELQTLYLAPGAWHRGAGSLLLRAAQIQLGRAGFSTASAWVLETNLRARTFYERHGWRFDGASKLHDWGTFVVTDIRYRLPLV
jgi:ribosomal protein S18 acetylase RimI-like enzyme